MRKPALTAKVVRGLRTIAAAISSAPDEILIGIEEEHFTAEDKRSLEDATRACEWIDELCRWHEAREGER